MISSKYFDHTILKAEATEAQVAKICDEALANDFASVCVNQYYTRFVAEKLKGSDVKVCTVVGFPLGMSDTGVKAFETKAAIEDGAQEIDMVINVGALKDKKYDYVKNDIHTLKEVCGSDIVLKVIIETCLLTDEEKVKACELAKEAGADFVKTSTGFSTGGAKAVRCKVFFLLSPYFPAAVSRTARSAVTVTALWKYGTTYLPSLRVMAREVILNFPRRISIPVWDLSVLRLSCRMWIPCSTLIR